MSTGRTTVLSFRIDSVDVRAIVALILWLGFSCFGQDAPGITTKVSESDRDKDGKIDVRIETAYRGKTKVMMTISRRTQQGVLAVQSRSYLAGGKLAAVESDEDGDGTLDSVAVFRQDSDDFEMFTRQADGMVRPVSTQKLHSIKRQKAVADESLRKVLDNPDMTSERLAEILEKNRQKIEAVKKEEKDGH